MPPTRPANTMTRIGMPIRPGTGLPFAPWMLTTLLLTVRATSMDRNAPRRFRIADRVTATFGLSAPVAMEVAIALAVSWNPLVKSNARAVTTTMIKMKSASVTTREPDAPAPCSRPERVPRPAISSRIHLQVTGRSTSRTERSYGPKRQTDPKSRSGCCTDLAGDVVQRRPPAIGRSARASVALIDNKPIARRDFCHAVHPPWPLRACRLPPVPRHHELRPPDRRGRRPRDHGLAPTSRASTSSTPPTSTAGSRPGLDRGDHRPLVRHGRRAAARRTVLATKLYGDMARPAQRGQAVAR